MNNPKNTDENVVQTETPKLWQQITPHPEPVGSEIFGEIIDDLRRYLFITEDNAIKGVFWITHANMFDIFQVTPRLIITAPMKNCGKTVTLSVLQAMTNRSLATDNITPAAFVRMSGQERLTFFWDEADLTFGKRIGDPDLIKALNGGYKRSGNFIKTVGEHHISTAFPTHSAVALAGINLDFKLPDQTLDRSIFIRMQRAKAGQLQERFKDRKHLPIFQRHGERLLRWCNDHREALKDHQPNIPDAVDNREYNNWQPLISIAEVASPEWGHRVMEVLLNQRPFVDDDLDVMFLQDCRRIYDLNFKGDKAIKPQLLAEILGGMADPDDTSHRPWARFHANKFREEQDARIKSRDCTKLLRKFDVHPITIRDGDGVFKGYKWADVLHAQETYAPMEDGYDDRSAKEVWNEDEEHDREFFNLTGEYVPGEDREEVHHGLV
jgi:putative DNA primase/helicase